MSMRYFQSLDLLPSHFERLEAPSIWLRDFMPLQRQDGSMVGFTYGCKYMYDFGEEIFDPSEVWARYNLKVNRLPIIADGGHFIETPRHWFASQAIFDENPNYLKSEINAMLTQALDKPLRWLPPMPGDFTGHLDGVVRWFQGDVVLVYDWFPTHKLRFWQANFNRILRTSGYKLVVVKLHCLTTPYQPRACHSITFLTEPPSTEPHPRRQFRKCPTDTSMPQRFWLKVADCTA